MGLRQVPNAVLQEMADHHEIRKLLAVFCHGCDRGDGGRMASIYSEDSFDDHGNFRGPGPRYAEKLIQVFQGQGKRTTHLLGQSQIKVDGDNAGAETYFLATVRLKDDEGQDVLNVMQGRYVDRLVRGGEGWRVKSRVCVRDWSIALAGMHDPYADHGFVSGTHSGDDPSYPALGLSHPNGISRDAGSPEGGLGR